MKRRVVVSILAVIVIAVILVFGFGALSERFVENHWSEQPPVGSGVTSYVPLPPPCPHCGVDVWSLCERDWVIYEGQVGFKWLWNATETVNLDVLAAVLSGSQVRFGPAFWPGSGELQDTESVAVYVRADDEVDFTRFERPLFRLWLWWDFVVFRVEWLLHS